MVLNPTRRLCESHLVELAAPGDKLLVRQDWPVEGHVVDMAQGWLHFLLHLVPLLSLGHPRLRLYGLLVFGGTAVALENTRG